MPIYEYQCSSCSATFSRLQYVDSTAENIRCPSCDSDQVERLLSVFASGGSAKSCPGAGPSCPNGGGFT